MESRFALIEPEYLIDDRDNCTSDPLSSIERVETPNGWVVERAIVWQADSLVMGDFSGKFYVKLILFSNPVGEAVKLCVQKFAADSEDVHRSEVWIKGAGSKDMDEIAEAIEQGPVIEDSRMEGG